jgi:hypothetical protein
MDLTVDEIQAILIERKILEREVGTETVYRWLRKGFFQGAYKAIGQAGRPWRIPLDSVEGFEERWTSK